MTTGKSWECLGCQKGWGRINSRSHDSVAKRCMCYTSIIAVSQFLSVGTSRKIGCKLFISQRQTAGCADTPVTLTLTWWSWYMNFTYICRRYTCVPKMNISGQGIWNSDPEQDSQTCFFAPLPVDFDVRVWYCKSELSSSMFSKVRALQTDRCDRTRYHSVFVGW